MEFIAAFLMSILILFIFINFIFILIESVFLDYAAFMSARTVKVNSGADLYRVTSRIVPWMKDLKMNKLINKDRAGVRIRAKAFNLQGENSPYLINKGWNHDVSLWLIPEIKLSNEYEDNPLKYRSDR